MEEETDPQLLKSPSVDPEGNIDSELDAILGDTELGFGAIDQDAFEREVAAQADRKVLENADDDDRRRLEKTEIELAKLQIILEKYRSRRDARNISLSERTEAIRDVEFAQNNIEAMKGDIRDIRSRIQERSQAIKMLGSKVANKEGRLPTETERDYLIRTGKITPFDKLPGHDEDEDEDPNPIPVTDVLNKASASKPLSAQNLRRPGFSQGSIFKKAVVPPPQAASPGSSNLSTPPNSPPRKKKGTKLKKRRLSSHERSGSEESSPPSKKAKGSHEDSESDYTPGPKSDAQNLDKSGASDSEKNSADESDDDWYVGGEVAKKPRKSKASKGKQISTTAGSATVTRLDDGDERLYQQRVRQWAAARKKAREQAGAEHTIGLALSDEEWRNPHPETPDKTLDAKFKLPGDIHPSLFDYQNVGVRWLWELYRTQAGGILGDEMGLGKTVQVIAFIAGLHYSGLLDKPVLIVAPGAVLKQWATEFHEWWPALRVAILHKSGSGMLTARASDADDDVFSSSDELDAGPRTTTSKSAARQIVNRVFEKGHILVTTYEGLTTYEDILIDRAWGHVVLDEGHKIKNPDTKVALNCKQLRTTHRIILSGTPIQNNLTELWSLFDFIVPGRLGDLPTFREQFEAPIRSGGFKNASNTDVLAASACAAVLRDQIGPFLMRRLKIDVLKDLPGKQEHIIRCKLTASQLEKYKEYLDSPEVGKILQGQLNALPGINTLRMICSHPDLPRRDELQRIPGYDYGNPKHSGKMLVFRRLLAMWKSHGNRTLLFSQNRVVLDVIEKDVAKSNYKYLRMDGTTPVSSRQDLVNMFNNDPTINVFLMTTRVGGLGLNLTGADRVVIFDPDWNPSTDLQARERAWRIGQTKPVEIYRLVAAFTIEEKMYARQAYKHHLSQKILTNSEQRRVFETETVKELFTLGESSSSTSDLFRAAEKKYTPQPNSDHEEGEVPENREHNDIENLNGVAGLAEYAPGNNTSPSSRDPSKGRGEQTFINQIFSAGVESTLEHDAIFGERKPGLNESKHAYSAANAFAQSVAREAERKLRASIEITQKAKIGTVTWTGRNGARPTPPPRPNAKGLLAGLKQKNGKKFNMKESMLKLFRQNDGERSTSEVTDWCKEHEINKLDPEKAMEMKRVLKEIACRSKHVWKLRRQYKEGGGKGKKTM